MLGGEMTGYQTKSEIVYHIILDRIISGEYKPGDKLIIRRIAKELNVSEIPIREAIKNLEAEGYVTHDANKSVLVWKCSRDEIDGVFHIKGVLEGYATRMSIDYLTPSDIEELKAINEEMRTACTGEEATRFSELNEKFHMRIYRDNPNRNLVSMIKELWIKWAVTRRVFATAPSRMDDSIADHERIIELIQAKDYDTLEMFTREHKFNAGREMIKKL